MPDWLPSWGTTALISIVTSLLTLIVAGPYIQPLLEVRNRRFQTKMQAREKFQASRLDVLSAAPHLLAAPVAPDATDTVRTALREERVRWRSQLDEATKYLTDHAVHLLFAYRGPRIPDLAVRYSSTARGVWISDRSEDRKLAIHPALPRPILRQPAVRPSAGPLLDGARTAAGPAGGARTGGPGGE
jgi:hypothetical protein